MTVTVFTPTYNRAYILPKLYESLKKQICNDFEWLIVDDGSTDETEKIVRGWLTEETFPIRYIKQLNGGKHAAINRGVLETKSELFFIVDSDDQLTPDAIAIIKQKYQEVRDDDTVAGIIGMRIYPDGKRIGGEASFEDTICTRSDFRYKKKINGDLAEVYKTDILRKYPFPIIEGEKFCPESVVWLKIAKKYKLLFVNKGIYVCEYLADGLTHHVDQIRIKSPHLAVINYVLEYGCDTLLKNKIKDAINYWRFRFHCHDRKDDSKIAPWAMPFGWLFYKLDCKKYPEICKIP